MSERHVIALRQEHDTPPARQARSALLDALADAQASEPDASGIFDVAVAADSREAALRAVWDALAASGGDDHLVIAEHSKVPEHWRRR